MRRLTALKRCPNILAGMELQRKIVIAHVTSKLPIRSPLTDPPHILGLLSVVTPIKKITRNRTRKTK
jgi:hypothetical protein